MSPAQRGEPLAWLKEQVATRDRSKCWTWPFGHNNHGYGQLKFNRIDMTAHGVALILDGKPRPASPNDCALHSCDNPPCCNPDHSRWGSRGDNARDMAERGRFRGVGPRGSMRGSHSPAAKLTEADVVAIRKDERRLSEIAQQYGVGITTIRDAKKYRNWKHIV